VVHITHPGFWFGFAPPQEVPLTQAELAAMSNVSRNTLGTILRSLQDAGLISIGYGKIRTL
jgi:CRP-like cAMP-binding protein